MANSDHFSVAILLYPGFSNMVLACLMEPLRALRDQGRASVDLAVLTADDQPVESSSGLRISPDMSCRAQPAVDLLIVVSGHGHLRHAARDRARALAALARKADSVLAADTAA